MRQKIITILQELRPELDFSVITELDEYLDSFDVVMLTVELEKEFKIKIDGIDIRKETYTSIDSIIKLINESKVS